MGNIRMSTYLFKPVHQTNPWSNVNGQFVNKWNSNSPANFGSIETSRQFGQSGIINKAEAAAASTMKGGSRKRSRKNNNILYKYKKMRGGGYGNKINGGKRRKSRKGGSRSRTRSISRRRTIRRQRGGASQYHQFGSQIPNTPSYSVGGMLSAKNSALANPAPIEKHSELGNCTDNYNHNTNKGFQWW